MLRKDIKNILKVFMSERGAFYNLQKLGIFGSYARNQATDESDIDIVFVTDKPDLFMTSMLRQDLEDLLGRRVDVVRLRKNMNSGFRARIEREAVYV